MADIGGDGAPLNISSFDSSVFTGRDEDFILPGDSLLSFPGTPGLGVGEGCASFQGSPSLLSSPVSFEPTASLPPTIASNAAATVSSRVPKSPGTGSEGRDDTDDCGGRRGRGEAIGGKGGCSPAPSLLQLLEAAVAAGDSESVPGSGPGSDPLHGQKGVEGTPVGKEKKPRCKSDDEVETREDEEPSTGSDDVEREGGQGPHGGSPSCNPAGKPDAAAPSAAVAAPGYPPRTPTTARLTASGDTLDPSVPSEVNMTGEAVTSIEGGHRLRLEKDRSARPTERVGSPTGAGRAEVAGSVHHGTAAGEPQAGDVGREAVSGESITAKEIARSEGERDDTAPVPSLSLVGPRNGMVGRLELIPGFGDTVDSHFVDALLQASDTQPHAVNVESRRLSYEADAEEGQTKRIERRAPIAVGDLEEAKGISGTGGFRLSAEPVALQGVQEQALAQAGRIAAPQSHPPGTPPLSTQVRSTKRLESNPCLTQRSPSPTPVPTLPVSRVPSVLSLTPPVSDPSGEPSEQPPARQRDSKISPGSSTPQEVSTSGPPQSAETSSDSANLRITSHLEADGAIWPPAQGLSSGGGDPGSAASQPVVQPADGRTEELRLSSQPLEVQASAGTSERKTVNDGADDELGNWAIHGGRPPLPRKAALRFTPRDHATQEKVAQHGYNPAQQLKAPLYKPVDAVFKFMLKKWSAISYGDLNNIRIIFDGGVGPLLKEATDANRGGGGGGGGGRESGKESGVAASPVSDAYIWGPARSKESLIDLIESLPESTRDRLCKHEVLDLTYTFVPGPLGPRQPLLPNRHMGNTVTPAGASDNAAPHDGEVAVSVATAAPATDRAAVIDVSAAQAMHSKPLEVDVGSRTGGVLAGAQATGRSPRPKRANNPASPRSATGQQPATAKAARVGRRARGSPDPSSSEPQKKTVSGNAPSEPWFDAGCERSSNSETRARSGRGAAGEILVPQASSPGPSGFQTVMRTANVASGIEGQVEASSEKVTGPPAAPSDEPKSQAPPCSSVTCPVSGPGSGSGGATSVVPSILLSEDAQLLTADPLLELDHIMDQGNHDGSNGIEEIEVESGDALMGEETCMALFGGVDARVDLLVDSSRRAEDDAPRSEGQTSLLVVTAPVDAAAADSSSPGLVSHVSPPTHLPGTRQVGSDVFAEATTPPPGHVRSALSCPGGSQAAAPSTACRVARSDSPNESNARNSDVVSADDVASGPASHETDARIAAQKRNPASEDTACSTEYGTATPSTREPERPSAASQTNPTERRVRPPSSKASAAGPRDVHSVSNDRPSDSASMKPPPPVPAAHLSALHSRRVSSAQVTVRRNGVCEVDESKRHSPVLTPPREPDAARSSTSSLEKRRVESFRNGGGEPATMANTGGSQSQGSGEPGARLAKPREGERIMVDSSGVTHPTSKECSAIGGVAKRRRAEGDDVERPSKKERVPGVTRSPRGQVGQSVPRSSTRDIEPEEAVTPTAAAALKSRPFAFAAAKNAERNQGGPPRGNGESLDEGKTGTTEITEIFGSPVHSSSSVLASLRFRTPSQGSPRALDRPSVLPSPACSFSPFWMTPSASIDLADIPTPTTMKGIQVGEGDSSAYFPGLLWNMNESGCDGELDSPKCEGPITRWLGLAASGDPCPGGLGEGNVDVATSGKEGTASLSEGSVAPSSAATAIASEEEGSKPLPTLIRLGRSMSKGLSLLPNPPGPSTAAQNDPQAASTAPAGHQGSQNKGKTRKDVGRHTSPNEGKESNIVTTKNVDRGLSGEGIAHGNAPISLTSSSSRSGPKKALESKPRKRGKKHRITPILVSNVLPTSPEVADASRTVRIALPSCPWDRTGSGRRLVADEGSKGSEA